MPELDELIDDDDDETLDAQVGETSDQVINRLRKVSRDQGKALKTLTKEVEDGKEAKKQLALIQADLPKDDPKVQFFLDNYKGEYTAEAVRTEAAKHGFIAVDQTMTNETNVIEDMMQVTTGATRSADPGTDAAMEREIKAITATGPEASKQIKAIMVRYGRYQEDE